MLFDDLYNKILSETKKSLNETSSAGGVGGGSVFGPSAEIGAHGGQVGNSDWYAPGDSRNLFGWGKVKKKKTTKKKKKTGKKKTNSINEAPILMPIVRRTPVQG